MKLPALNLVRLLLILTFLLPGPALAQGNDEVTRLLVQSYDLLEAGKLDQAQKIFEKILQEHPGEPLALNNLAAVMVKKGEYKQALNYLEQALPRAKGYKVKVNRVCDVNGICLAFRPLSVEYGNQDLEGLVRLNIQMVKAKVGLKRMS